MRETMWRQPDDLRRVLGDPGPAERAAERIAGRRVLLSGTGTSWHAANHGAALLRLAGVEAWAVQADESVLHGPAAGRRRRAGAAQPPRHEALHERGARPCAERRGRRDRADLRDRRAGRRHRDVRARDAARRSRPATSARSRACARSRARSAPISGRSRTCPDAVAAELDDATLDVPPPARLLQFVGQRHRRLGRRRGRAEGPRDGLRRGRRLLDGVSAARAERRDRRRATRSSRSTAAGREGSAWTSSPTSAPGHGARVHRFRRDALGEALSVFALTTVVQRIALEAAERLGTDPDSFGKDLPGRGALWASVPL